MLILSALVAVAALPDIFAVDVIYPAPFDNWLLFVIVFVIVNWSSAVKLTSIPAPSFIAITSPEVTVYCVPSSSSKVHEP